MNDNPLDMIWIILVLALVFYLAWLFTRFVAVRSKGKAAGRFMRVVDRLNIGNDKAILVVKVGADYCVIGVTGHEMRLLKTLDGEEAEPYRTEAEKQGQPWPEASAAAGIFKGMQTFSERLGFAMRRPAGRRQDAAEYDRQAAPKGGKEQDGEQSVIDMMNERIKLRKESKRH